MWRSSLFTTEISSNLCYNANMGSPRNCSASRILFSFWHLSVFWWTCFLRVCQLLFLHDMTLCWLIVSARIHVSQDLKIKPAKSKPRPRIPNFINNSSSKSNCSARKCHKSTATEIRRRKGDMLQWKVRLFVLHKKYKETRSVLMLVDFFGCLVWYSKAAKHSHVSCFASRFNARICRKMICRKYRGVAKFREQKHFRTSSKILVPLGYSNGILDLSVEKLG